MLDWQRLVEPLAPTKPFVVNIGANDGVGNHDPTAFWLTRPDARGLALEGKPGQLPALQRNYPSPEVAKVIGFVNPTTVGDVFAREHVPTDVFVLKIDIDGYDSDVLHRVLTLGYRPRFVYLEIAHNFPPGFWYKVPYAASRTYAWRARGPECQTYHFDARAKKQWNADHTGGSSANVFHSMMTTGFGEYQLLGILANNMLYGLRSLVNVPAGGVQDPSLKCAYDEGFMRMPFFGRIAVAYHDVRQWRIDKIPRERRLRDMKEVVHNSCSMVRMRNESNGVDYPYELRLAGEDDGVPLQRACEVDSCSGTRIMLRAR